MAKVLVRKKGGYLEEFDIKKIESSLINAGCNSIEAESIANKIRDWAENRPGRTVHSFEIERQIIEYTKEKNKDALISFLIYARNKIKPIRRIFDKKDIAQMLTSLFAIIQVYVLDKATLPFNKAVPILITSFFTCMTILTLIEGKQMWKHLISGFLLVFLLSTIVGIILEGDIPSILVAVSVGLPVAAMVDVLRD